MEFYDAKIGQIPKSFDVDDRLLPAKILPLCDGKRMIFSIKAQVSKIIPDKQGKGDKIVVCIDQDQFQDLFQFEKNMNQHAITSWEKENYGPNSTKQYFGLVNPAFPNDFGIKASLNDNVPEYLVVDEEEKTACKVPVTSSFSALIDVGTMVHITMMIEPWKNAKMCGLRAAASRIISFPETTTAVRCYLPMPEGFEDEYKIIEDEPAKEPAKKKYKK